MGFLSSWRRFGNSRRATVFDELCAVKTRRVMKYYPSYPSTKEPTMSRKIVGAANGVLTVTSNVFKRLLLIVMLAAITATLVTVGIVAALTNLVR